MSDSRYDKWEEVQRMAERAFTASLVAAVKHFDNSAVAEVAAWFDPKWIVDDFHRTITRHVFRLASAGIPVTSYSLATKLVQSRRYHKVNWETFANWFIDATGYPYLRFYACEVYDNHRRRHIASEALMAGDQLRTGEELEKIIDQLTSFTQRYAPPPALRGKKNEDAFAELTRELEGKNVDKLDTGMYAVDGLMGGLEPGNVLVIGARPSCGKSAMLGHIAAHVATELEKGVLVFSMEMSTKEIYGRWSAWLAECSKSERKEMVGGMAKLHTLTKKGLLHVFPGEYTVASIERNAKTYSKQLPIGMIVVDYLQLVTPTISTKNDTRDRQVGDISRRLKALAMALDVVVATASQLKREGSDKPTLSHLRESGSIEQDADKVILLHPQEDKPISKIHVVVAKNRNGDTGVRTLRWHKSRFRFYDEHVAEGF
jgi:replicative DNA helicase